MGLRKRMDAFLLEMPRDLGKWTSDPCWYIFVGESPNHRPFARKMNGKEVGHKMGVLCRKRDFEVDKKSRASAIGNWLELWSLILCCTSKKSPFRLQTNVNMFLLL